MYLQHLRGVQRTEGPKNISEEEAEKLHQVKQFATSRELTMQPVTHADYDLLVGDLYHPSPGIGYTGIGTISPLFIVQLLDNDVNLRLKSFDPPVRFFASYRFLGR